MAEPPVTRVTLLARIRDGRDADAWREFVQLYGPVVYRFARNRGLQDADAADLMQDVLRSVARNAHRMEYDPSRGTFRGWLYTVTRNKIYNFLNGQRHRPRGTGDTDAQERLDATPARDEDGPDADWEREYQRRLTARAMERVREEFQPATWQAFSQTAVEGKSAAEVGARLKMSPGAVYVAKSRVLARLRDEVRKMMEDEDEPASSRR
ncbi:MAG TPA: sigma-70 family RNA polymerase sigma factor [Gemmataceae bacterium]|nr:sigma-70 family RNA polymerase sigma factor [Gemmataceae bacterium]